MEHQGHSISLRNLWSYIQLKFELTYVSSQSVSFRSHSIQEYHIQFNLVSIELKLIKEGGHISCA